MRERGRRFPAGPLTEIQTAPRGSSVTQLHMSAVMATATQRDKVVSCVSATTTDRNNVMNLFHRYCASFLQTVLTQRVRLGVAVADTLPCSAVLFVYIWASFVPVVAPAHLCRVLLTVLTFRQVRAAGVSARLHRFLWHIDFTFFQI